jgi:hypothetical protein
LPWKKRRIMSGKLWKYGAPGVVGVERKRICSRLIYAPNDINPSFEHDRRHASVCADEPAHYQRFMENIIDIQKSGEIVSKRAWQAA